MPPKQRVDLDLDALAPPNRTIRLHGKVYDLPGDIGIDTIVRSMRLQSQIESNDEEQALAALNSLLEIIYDLFRECDPKFTPEELGPLSFTQVMNILGLVLSGANVDFNEALRDTLAGEEEADEQPAQKDDGSPPTSLKAVEGKGASPSRRRSLAAS